MFYHRGFSHDVEALHFKVVALCALFYLSTFGPCTMTGSNNPTGHDLISHSEDVLIDDITKRTPPQTSTPKLSLENICQRLDSFCFPSTLSGFFSDFHSREANISSFSQVKGNETVNVGSMQQKDNLSWSSNHSNFHLLSRRVVSCSLESKKGDENDTQSCRQSSGNQKEESVRIKSRLVDDFSSLHVQISHPLLDWGIKYLHIPSVAYLTVENRHNHSVLNVFEPYSTNLQFYPCNHSEVSLEPGETASICFVFLPKWLGLSSAQIILQTSSGGYLIQAQGFAVESPYYAIQPLIGTTSVFLLLENSGPDVMKVVKISTAGENTESLQTKYVEGLILFPQTVTQVAMVTYNMNPHMNFNCKLLVETNKSDAPDVEISCNDIVSACLRSHSYAGYGVLNYDDVETRSSNVNVQPSLDIKATEITEVDESVLGNWRSQGTEKGMSVLVNSEITFPMIHVATHHSKWIHVINPSDQPAIMQLLLNSGEIINECRGSDEIPQPSSSYTLVLNDHVTPSRFGFSIARNALTEAYVHPHGKAVLGPIVFHPSSRCSWRSSALVRNNLSGVEWLSLRGSGGSLSMVLLDGSDPVHIVKLNRNYGQPSVKVLFAKNVGDLPLQVNSVSVSGTKCGSNGFVVGGGCKGFSLQPEESRELIISYRSDVCMEIVRRELELAMTGGILVVPMEVSLSKQMPMICKRSFLWIKFKKSVVAVFASVFLVSMACSCSFSLVIEGGKFSEPENLTVKTEKNKTRRRKKKRNSNALLTTQFEASSSLNSNSTPSSPLSPILSFSSTSHLSLPPPCLELSSRVETRNPFEHCSTSGLESKPWTPVMELSPEVETRSPVKNSSTSGDESKPLKPAKSETSAPWTRASGGEGKAVQHKESSEGNDVILYNIWDDHLRYLGALEGVAMMPAIAQDNNFCSLFSVSPQEYFSTCQGESVSSKQDG